MTVPPTWSREKCFRHRGWTIVPETNCWEWGGWIDHNGYGRFPYKKKSLFAHRVSYEVFVGTIPDGLLIRHKCDNPPCMNPDHLETGTQADNIRDMIERGRKPILSGENGPMAKLSREEANAIRDEYAHGVLTQKLLAEAFGLDQSTVSDIITGRSYAK